MKRYTDLEIKKIFKKSCVKLQATTFSTNCVTVFRCCVCKNVMAFDKSHNIFIMVV